MSYRLWMMPVNPQDAWTAALNQLEIQLDPANFETWVRGAVFLGCQPATGAEPARFSIGVGNSYARDMLAHRLYRSVRRVLGDVYGAPVELVFEVCRPPQSEPVDLGDMPLFRALHAAPPAPVPDSDERPLHQRIQPAAPEALPDSALNPRFTFDRFIVGQANLLTYSAALAVAETPGSIYNPLMVYGGVGLGKTHLLHAIAHACRARGRDALYISSEAFSNDLVGAIRNRTTAMFRDRYRRVDVLLVDDVQFIGGKEGTQEEFFHTFNALHTFNKQVVLASDRPPAQIEGLEDRLRSRFEGGLVVDVQPPEFETRLAILEMWAAERGMRVGHDVLALVAERGSGNLRELQGLFTQIVAKSQLGSAPVDSRAAQTIIQRFDRPRHHKKQDAPTMDQIIEATAAHYHLKPRDLTGKGRAGRVNQARQMAMYLARLLTDLSLPQIGEALGGRSHTTVMHGCNKITDALAVDALLSAELAAVRTRLGG